MPYASRFYPRRRRRNRFRKRQPGFNRTRRAPRKRPAPGMRVPKALPIGGFPRTKVVKLRYVEQTTLTPGAGNVPTHQYRANSCFDPDLTGTGHQPLFYDQWAAIYDHYTVLGSKITVSFQNFDSHYGMVGIQTDDNAVVSGVGTDGSYSKILENGTKHKPIGPKGTYGTKFVTSTYSAKRMFGLRDTAAVMSRTPDLGAAIGANPSEGSYYNVWATSTDQSAFTDAIVCNVIIDYIVAFSEKSEEIAQS